MPATTAATTAVNTEDTTEAAITNSAVGSYMSYARANMILRHLRENGDALDNNLQTEIRMVHDHHGALSHEQRYLIDRAITNILIQGGPYPMPMQLI